MIKVTPAQVVPYAPASMPVDSARVQVLTVGDTVSLQVRLFTAQGAPIPVDQSQIGKFDAAAQAAYLSYRGGNDSLTIALQKAALPFITSAYKLNNLSVV